ncbi:ImmA/IrrE family metallo-endopeptidase [Clostridium estertheticum]|uniref:ImmA/IrrE family metallo-endopeptidase n=1 Tax=Clostridium estertheticum TaxID=238834 RepID=UPI001C0B362E|nr:ImmA/IrrE family metallo-endopeptidase [Clostridium estertheticum]MBU3171386.1 ImmA/IrrE family metallo-endopeptidase [Clostridium estertheticum]MBU3185625.1 ImmA/IrrE family metallo-endopeptidase [Clostridium estertheticum]
MTEYENLLIKSDELGIEVKEIDFGDCDECGYYCNSKILINSNLTENQKHTVLAEELGHHFYTYGDITNQLKIENKKQEKIARNWGYEKLVGIIDIINTYKQGTKNRHDMAEQLNVTEEFLEASIHHYKEKYGLCYKIDHYIIYFDPLGVLEMF